MKFARLVGWVILAVALSGCAEFMRVWVPPPVATPATTGKPPFGLNNRYVTYWHALERNPACKIEDEYSQRVQDFSWTGECKKGLAEGCGTLIGPISKMTGCFVAGKKSGRIVEETTDSVTVFVYSPTEKVQESYVVKPGQAERDRIRREAYAAELAEKRRRDSEEIAQAVQNLNIVLDAAQTKAAPSVQPQLVDRPVASAPASVYQSPSVNTNQDVPVTSDRGQAVATLPPAPVVRPGAGPAQDVVRDFPAPDANHCMKVKESGRGKQCGSSTSLVVVMTNTCPEVINMQLCIFDLRYGNWSCGANGAAGPGAEVIQYVCETDQRKFLYAGCTKRAQQGRFRNGNCGGNPNGVSAFH